jgi:hypothetical protein
LPDKIKTDYTLAIPIIDTTISLGDFATIARYEQLIETIEIPAETPINMGEQSYPFYIGEYSPSQTIEWLEPQLIIDTKDLPSGTKINIKIYTKDEFGRRSYFWLSDDYSITLTHMPVKVPETPQTIKNIDQFRDATSVFLDIDLIYPTAVTGSQIVDAEINIKFAIKFAIKTDLKVKL